MVFCHLCGAEISEDAFFCLKCGERTVKGAEAGVAIPKSRWEKELEKAFSKAAESMDEAFARARENIRKAIYGEPIVCKNCEEKNPADSSFCRKCGKAIKS